jgi:hypothetical protein
MEGDYIPTISFDSSLITETVKADLLDNIECLQDVTASNVSKIYEVALRAISVGGDLHVLATALIAIGVNRRRAGDVARYLYFNATALIEAERMKKLGIDFAIWRYSGAPCGDPEQDAAHRAADGKRYPVTEGLRVNGQFTLPGRAFGCKCTSAGVIPGME